MSNLPLPIAAFVAGLFSFLSPCVLPMVPGYLSMISGATLEELQAQEKHLLRKVMLNSVAFIMGFSMVFIIEGATATEIGQLLGRYKVILARVAGAVIILFGLHMTGILRINALYADKRLHNVKGGNTVAGAFLIGFAFAFGWQACTGPILGTILAFAADQDTVLKGVGLLAVYSLGLAVPFLLAALLIERFLKFYGRFRNFMHALEVFSGAILIALGALLLSGRFTLLANYLSFLGRFVR